MLYDKFWNTYISDNLNLNVFSFYYLWFLLLFLIVGGGILFV